MPNNIQKIVAYFSKQVEKILGSRLKRIVLYGSYARGDYRSNSDIDIMILTDLSDEEIEDYRDKIVSVAFDIELENGIIISPVIKNIDKINAKIDFIPFYMNVQKEGVVLVDE